MKSLQERIQTLEADVARLKANAPNVNQENPNDIGAFEPPHYEVTYDEEAAVALLRRWAADPGASGDGYIRLTPCEANHVLNALDRATAERDAALKDAAFWEGREQVRVNEWPALCDLKAQVAHYRLSWESAERTIKALRNELRDQLTDARSEAVVLRATEENLRAELARLTATEDTPLGWVNVYESKPCTGSVYSTKEWAETAAGMGAARVAVPVYERPPRATARDRYCEDHPFGCPTSCGVAAPDARVVGACVVKDGDVTDAWTTHADGGQSEKEVWAMELVQRYGGTAHQLWLGKKIATEGGR